MLKPAEGDVRCFGPTVGPTWRIEGFFPRCLSPWARIKKGRAGIFLGSRGGVSPIQPPLALP